MGNIHIGSREIGAGQRPYIIAEIGINHNGDIAIAKKLVDVAVNAGADAVKLQTRTVEIVYSQAELEKPRPVPRTILENAIRRGVLSDDAVKRLRDSNFEHSTNGDLKHALELTDDELIEFDCYCRLQHITWLTSCWDVVSLGRIDRMFDLPAHKIASACNEDDDLLRRVRATGKSIIMSTGMTDLTGVRRAVEVVGREQLILLHCTSVYPKGTESGDEILRLVNLRGMDTLREEFDVPVGFSSHDSGIMPSYAAAARGAVVIEKHITLERSMWGSDQGSSIEPLALTSLCRMVHELHIALGDGQIVVYPDEEEVAQKLRRVRRSV